MSINWFPGHMHKAQKEIRQLVPEVDLVIEVLDARLPYSSQNPLLQKLRGQKPCIKLLNKSDLADPDLNQKWIEALQQDKTIKAYAVNTSDTGLVRQIPQWCLQWFPERETNKKPIQVMIMGVPNVGKSTLINIMADRTIAKTGNEAAVTKMQQRIKLPGNVILHDTPGVLWPRFDNQNSAFRLAVTGGIKDNIVAAEDKAFFLAEYVMHAYHKLIEQRYDIQQIPQDPYDLLVKIGQKRGALKAGGRVDLTRISSLFINEFREGRVGRITLETPEMMEQELIDVDRKLAAKAAKKAARKEQHKGRQ
ncbi:ribosome biogenesis GTPase YlqF [Marinicella sp. S1101]|uniref:ribosome biogenesis GTPase YlqF n=1 Tax=Marinicella marina TaxID=2996016 RepID=UPI00226089C9|nr:ribosome biogenesis GTPase YlqF [Marinicella marina]MCX7552922.1 ribosome biogenesis GTPase YlqF [Marinicella marina]MDJ1139769.1 ribosome biogenesis GTPase YlqF [Marinicella marina]